MHALLIALLCLTMYRASTQQQVSKKNHDLIFIPVPIEDMHAQVLIAAELKRPTTTVLVGHFEGAILDREKKAREKKVGETEQ